MFARSLGSLYEEVTAGMNRTWRHVGLPSLVLALAMALLFVGCGGGDGTTPLGPDRGGITGQVMSATGDALGGITVTAGGVSTTTANDGTFTLLGISPGQHVIDATAAESRNLRVWGAAVERTVTVVAGRTTEIDPLLMTEPLDLPEPPM